MKAHLLFPLLAFTAASADVTLPPLFSDNLLLQQPRSAVWGKADPGEKVTVTLGKTSAKATAEADGKWRAELAGLKPGLAGDLTVAGKNTLTVRNVAVGDVWVGSGQSNMEMTVVSGTWCKYGGALDAAREAAEADYPALRMFITVKKGEPQPMENVEGRWEVCTPENLPHWSAAGYFFARQLHRDLGGLPIGLIQSSVGGSACQSWTPDAAVKADPELNQFYPRRGGLYNGMIAGLTPFPVKGVIWYQGEANVGVQRVGDSTYYRRLLPAMIDAWRKAWNRPDLPFYIVQLANWRAQNPEPADSLWADLREAQREIANKIPDTGLAVAIDIGDEKNIHPANKQEVGRRLALVAEAKTYGKPVESSGPAFEAARFDGAQVRVRFRPGTAAGLHTKGNAPVKAFAIAGEDRKFYWAQAQIISGSEGDASLALTSPRVAKPVAVRYAWANNPEVNLVNRAGLPAVPFRTDDWPQNDPTTVVATPAPSPAPSASPSPSAPPSPAVP